MIDNNSSFLEMVEDMITQIQLKIERLKSVDKGRQCDR